MIEILDLNSLKNIYNCFMINDFPEDELKPFEMIEELIVAEKSLAIGYYEDNIFKGYATILYAGDNLLLDYFAVIKNYRGKGHGTRFLLELKDYFKDYGFLLIESENNDSETARKRIEFYKNCGCKDSFLRGRLYFVEYSFLYLELSATFSADTARKEIFNIYKKIYPDYLNTRFLVFH